MLHSPSYRVGVPAAAAASSPDLKPIKEVQVEGKIPGVLTGVTAVEVGVPGSPLRSLLIEFADACDLIPECSMNPALTAYARTIFSSPAFQQLAPLAVIFIVPLIVLSARTPTAAFIRFVSMVFGYIGSLFSWGSPSEGVSSSKKLKKKNVRSRADQLANGDVDGNANYDDGYYPGLVNISGTYCFMDSTLQAFASLTYLQPYLDAIHDQAEAFDVPTPVVDALRDLLTYLNKPSSNPMPLRPTAIIAALSQHSARKQSLFASREHQDAQELFQLVSECIKDEAAAVIKEGRRDKGFGGLPPPNLAAPGGPGADIARSVFDGLTANRRSCVECGYTEAVMHFGFDSWQLAVPRDSGGCRLEDCIAEYTKLEVLTDCMCRKCSLVATHRKLAAEALRLSEAAEADGASHSKRKRARESRKFETRVREALEAGRIEEDIKGVTLERVFSKASTKQAMIARPPPVLALHLNRSIHYGHYAGKNNARVLFPELLDLTAFTTSGTISTQPSLPISSAPSIAVGASGATLFYARGPMPDPLGDRAATPKPLPPRTLYRLAAVVCHYGAHSFGHYVCYRRKPRSPSAGSARFNPPKLACPLGCQCAECVTYGPVRDDGVRAKEGRSWSGGGGWLRISDDDVREVPLQSVLAEAEGAFMLYYERVTMPLRPLGVHEEARSSEETVRPRDAEPPVLDEEDKSDDIEAPRKKIARTMSVPRVVRAVATGRGRSFSPASFASVSMENVVESQPPPKDSVHMDLVKDVEEFASLPTRDTQPALVQTRLSAIDRPQSTSPSRSPSARRPSDSPLKARKRTQIAMQNGSARSPSQQMDPLPLGVHV